MYIFNLLNMFVLVVTTRALSSLNCNTNVLVVAQSQHKCTRCRSITTQMYSSPLEHGNAKCVHVAGGIGASFKY